MLVNGSCCILTLGHRSLADVALRGGGYALIAVRVIVFRLLAILGAVDPRIIIVTTVIQLRG